MTSIGTGYDLAASTYSPDGRLFQLEYAQKAIDTAPTVLAFQTPTAIVMATEHLRPTRLLKPSANPRIHPADQHIAVMTTGLPADGVHLMKRAREEAMDWRRQMATAMPAEHLADRIGHYCQQHTLYSSVRPFGACMVMGGVNEGGLGLFVADGPTGAVSAVKGAAMGRGRQHAKTELEMLLGGQLSEDEGVKAAVRILVAARHEDPSARERQVELEVAVVRIDGAIVHVPLEQLKVHAKNALDAINSVMEFEQI